MGRVLVFAIESVSLRLSGKATSTHPPPPSQGPRTSNTRPNSLGRLFQRPSGAELLIKWPDQYKFGQARIKRLVFYRGVTANDIQVSRVDRGERRAHPPPRARGSRTWRPHR